MSVQAIKEYNKDRVESDIRNLIDRLNEYTKLYDEGHPAISDKEWDDLYFYLVSLENEYNIYFEDSPTQKINYQVVNELKKVKHSHLMLSLDKTKSIDSLKAFIGNKSYIVMAKMDGLTCSLTYDSGRLIKAETRGNGEIGEDILHNALQIKNIPNKINYQGRIVIDGEVICDYKTFENFSNEYKNPRNFASGSIRLLDSKESATRGLSFIAWDCIEGLERTDTLSEKLHYLRSELGFNIVPYIVNDNKTIEEYIEFVKSLCQDLYYPIDGVVVKYNAVKDYLVAGRTDHHFKGGMAYKFYDETYISKLTGIEWSMGRTGQICPIALFEALNIDGTEISRASLSNISIMKKTLGNHPFVGQEVEVTKRNQIIPKIERAKNEEGEWIIQE